MDAVSLTFQVFSACMKGYQLLTEAQDMPNEYKYMRIHLKKEQYRLLDWGHVAGVAELDDALGISSSDKGLLHDVLEQQQLLLNAFGKYEKRHNKTLERLEKPLIKEVADGSEDGNFVGLLRTETDFQNRFPNQGELLLQKSLEWAKKSRTYPRRLRWATFDKKKFEQLLLKLSSFNDFLSEMLNREQLNSLAVRQERTHFHIIQLNNKIDQLVEIVQAGHAWSDLTKGYSGRSSENPLHLRGKALLEDRPTSALSHSSPLEFLNGERSDGLYSQILVPLARFKALETAISTQDLTDENVQDLQLGYTASEVYNVELDPKSITVLDDELDDENRRVDALYDHNRVWIEWKPYEPRVFDGEPDPKIKERIIALVALLKENNRSRQFRAPRCLGYFRDIDTATGEDRCRFGVVFKKPSHVSSTTKPISLLELLRATEMGKTEMPSLTERVTLAKVLAEAVERLHAVNWLHKGLRSENILFFNDEIAPEDLEQEDHFSLDALDFSTPYLSGFDYARPAQNEDLTEKPPENAAYDLYRHPLVQGSRGGTENSINFQKAFDIYALGVILLEIIFWQPIDRILDVDLRKARPSTTLRVRSRLIEERKFLAQVKANAGVMLEKVVQACLVGPAALVDFSGADFDDKNAADAARLQMEFYDKVVKKLGEVKV
ncbi:hypothetical protein GTA08_BOTSDO05555 [Neofusicoccum parvum]|uniref:Uncharacterized protein n=1 Tax=Neofusicoccum parvum TaxID=310453 RepID=A0ACB5RSE0_9PEZI|nr:hypothetical protein GTA08_BOTSDO05555 [Neofusicoccum parvum]